MAIGNETSQQMEMTVAAAMTKNNDFPVGLRVLIVDDDRVCLRILEFLLRHCKYQPTMVQDGMMALRMLREGRDQFDVVISDVHMPDMDGFTLLKLIGLDMDIPVIMLSVSNDKEAVYRGIVSEACDYLVKPVNIKELKNIWQHVVRRKNPKTNLMRQPPMTVEGGARIIEPSMNYGERNLHNYEDGPSRIEKNKTLSTKKPRVRWTRELHGKFFQAVHGIGIDRAVPKNICEMMNVSHISRECVASHLQKYRLYLKRLGGFNERSSNPLSDLCERRSSYTTMENQKNNHEQKSSSSNNDLLWNPQSSIAMGSVIHGSGIPKDARRLAQTSQGLKLKAKIDDATMLFESDYDEILSHYNGNSSNILRQKC